MRTAGLHELGGGHPHDDTILAHGLQLTLDARWIPTPVRLTSRPRVILGLGLRLGLVTVSVRVRIGLALGLGLRLGLELVTVRVRVLGFHLPQAGGGAAVIRKGRCLVVRTKLFQKTDLLLRHLVVLAKKRVPESGCIGRCEGRF